MAVKPSGGFMGRFLRPTEDTESFHRLQRILDYAPTKRILPWLNGATPSLLPKSSDEINVDCDEIVKNLYLGGETAAKNRAFLQNKGFTHVLNAAHGKRFGFVNTGRQYYKKTNVQYKGISIVDLPSENIKDYFEEATDFIDRGIRRDGKILVHCVMGVSRSATLVCAYLMSKYDFTAAQALTVISRSRDVRPNDGFLRQLLQFEQELRHKRPTVYPIDA